jgi:hypothetical protein
LTIERLGLQPEAILGRSSIADQFAPSFFETDFWFMWCSTFAFQPWHSATAPVAENSYCDGEYRLIGNDGTNEIGMNIET